MRNIPLSPEQRWRNLSPEQRARLAEFIQKNRAAGQVAPPKPATASTPSVAQIKTPSKTPIGPKPAHKAQFRSAVPTPREKPANGLVCLNLRISPSAKHELKLLAVHRRTSITQLLLDGIEALKQQQAGVPE